MLYAWNLFVCVQIVIESLFTRQCYSRIVITSPLFRDRSNLAKTKQIRKTKEKTRTLAQTAQSFAAFFTITINFSKLATVISNFWLWKVLSFLFMHIKGTTGKSRWICARNIVITCVSRPMPIPSPRHRHKTNEQSRPDLHFTMNGHWVLVAT